MNGVEKFILVLTNGKQYVRDWRKGNNLLTMEQFQQWLELRGMYHFKPASGPEIILRAGDIKEIRPYK